MNSESFVSSPPWLRPLLKAFNLRPGEGPRTLLMFSFYTLMCMGIMWLEVSSAALFLEEYGADTLPFIYMFSAVVGFSLSSIYSWLQRWLPLRRVIVLIALLMTLPLLAFRIGLGVPVWAPMTIFVMRLWMEAITNLNELNVAVTANQLFNIREIKRAYPLISSGNLAADALSGFTIYFLLGPFSIDNIPYLAFGIMLIGTVILFYVSQSYRHAFPDSLRRRSEGQSLTFSARRLRGSIKRYVVLLCGFFVIAQVLLYLVEFQYLDQITAQGFSVDNIAKFLGIFTGILGLVELITQIFTASRLIERIGVFMITSLLPVMIMVLGGACLGLSLPRINQFQLFGQAGIQGLFLGLILLKFIDEWLRYTVVNGTRPVLFQPIPDRGRARVQSLVGVTESVSIGLTGALILLLLMLSNRIHFLSGLLAQSRLFLLVTILLAGLWLGIIYFLRSQYLNLLVLSAERGLLSFSDTNLRVLKQAIIETFDQPNTEEEEKRSCIELLTHIDPNSVSEVLAPMLSDLSPSLQRQGLETMLEHPNPVFTGYVEALIYPNQQPYILALALRYVYLTQPEPDLNQLKPYLKTQIDPVVRGTAASMKLRLGDRQQRAEATYLLQQMLTHEQERERVMGCRALGEAEYMQGMRLHVPKLLRDDSLRVRCALLSAIAATQLEDYYPSLIQALRYKSTREAATHALVKLGNEVLPMLVNLARNPYKPDPLRHQAWQVIGRIGTLEALDILVSDLLTAWGPTRRWILRILLKLADEQSISRSANIDAALDRLGRSRIETLLDQELTFLGQIYCSLVDLSEAKVSGDIADWLRRALRDGQADAIERMFLLMRFLYPSSTIQAAELSLEGPTASRARGLEILDNTLDIPAKRAILTVLDIRNDVDKLNALSELVGYRPMPPRERLRYLVDLRPFLSDWTLACCFHLARTQVWRLVTQQVTACLQHPVGFVREAVLSYIEVVSPKSMAELLPRMANDPNRLVAAQVKAMIARKESGGATTF
ncbi:MAG: Npt1/Npt2 family nucleotide transporter [Cyanobacteria bacterium J06635_1]